MSLRPSKKHGFNPTIPKCFLCNKDKNELLMFGYINPSQKKAMGIAPDEVDPEAPRGMVFDREPCNQCQEYMQQGIILISVRNGEDKKPDNDNPYRTGGWIVVKEECIGRMIDTAKLVEHIKKARMAFIPDEAWDALCLPRGEVEGVPTH